jgi:hypothetical protein
MKRLALHALPLLFAAAACSSGTGSAGGGATNNALLEDPGFGTTFDPVTGTGFVAGPAGVREALDWTEAQLEENAANLQFRAASVTESSWTCRNENNGETRQERQVTTTLVGLGVMVERDGGSFVFVLTGYADVEPIVRIKGPYIDYCPAFNNNNSNNDNPDNWVLEQPAGAPQPVGDVALMVSGDDGRLWWPLP